MPEAWFKTADVLKKLQCPERIVDWAFAHAEQAGIDADR
jgi:hypothetical protein